MPANADRGHKIRVVLTAAAFDHDWLNPGNLYGRALCRTDALLNLVNQHDWALAFYHLRTLSSKQAVGRLSSRRLPADGTLRTSDSPNGRNVRTWEES